MDAQCPFRPTELMQTTEFFGAEDIVNAVSTAPHAPNMCPKCLFQVNISGRDSHSNISQCLLTAVISTSSPTGVPVACIETMEGTKLKHAVLMHANISSGDEEVLEVPVCSEKPSMMP